MTSVRTSVSTISNAQPRPRRVGAGASSASVRRGRDVGHRGSMGSAGHRVRRWGGQAGAGSGRRRIGAGGRSARCVDCAAWVSLFLVRHATTDASASGRNLGQRPMPLSAAGHRLAAAGIARTPWSSTSCRTTTCASSPARRVAAGRRSPRWPRMLGRAERGEVTGSRPGCSRSTTAVGRADARRMPRPRPGDPSRLAGRSVCARCPGGESGEDVAARCLPDPTMA